MGQQKIDTLNFRSKSNSCIKKIKLYSVANTAFVQT